ncbi:MAG: mercuric ion transport protein [Micromonosporaceae bacterium]|nr:mercuric ion transport protein [Micromonosporaceae bacterium]
MRSAVRKLLPSSLTGLAGLACALCCTIPLLLAAGVIGGATWAGLGQVMPGIAVILAVLAGGAWWLVSRRRRGHTSGCSGGACSCAAS